MKALTLVIGMIFAITVLSAGVTFSYHLNTPELIKTEHGIQIKLDGTQSYGNVGDPDLPWFGYKLLLPLGTEASEVIVKRYSAVRFPLEDIVYPLQPQYPLSHKTFEPLAEPNAEIYMSEKVFPQKADRGLRTEYMNGHPVAFGVFSPFEYDPQNSTLLFFSDIEIEIQYSSSAKAVSALNLLKKDSFIENRLHQSVDNAADIPSYSLYRESGYEYLMLVDAEKISLWQPLANYYESRGITVLIQPINQILTTMEGQDDQEKIRNFIIAAYEENPLRYVLLGGDTDLIPHRGLYVSMGYEGETDEDIPADMYYSCLDGNWNYDNDQYWGEGQEADLVPELALGRICYNSDEEILNQINKISMYQMAPVENQVKSSLFVGEWLWDGPTWGGDYMDELIGGSSAHGYTTVGVPTTWDIDTLYDRTSGYSDAWGSMDILPMLSQGANLVNHQGHSNTTYNMRISNNQVTANSITNDGALHNFSIYFTQGCYAGSFDNRDTNPNSYTTDCISEKFTSLPTAAAGMISHSRYGWGVQGSTNGASQYLHREYIDAIFGENIHQLGYTLVDSKIDNIPFITGSAVMYWVTYETNLLGCPLTNIWSDTPAVLSVNLPSIWLVGMTQYTIQTNAPNAQIKIKQGAEIFYEGISDATGVCEVSLSEGLIPGNYSLYVNAPNFYPYAHNFSVTSSEMPYIVCEDLSFNDDDGIIHTSEVVDLSMTIKNLGLVDLVGSGIISLSSDSPHIEILDGEYSFESINASDSLWAENAFQIQVTGNFADATQAPLTFTANFGEYETASYAQIVLAAPNLNLVSYRVQCEGSYAMPGDTVGISFSIQNTGSGNAFEPIMMLFSNDSMVNTSVFELSIPVLEHGSTVAVENAFSVSISELAETGNRLAVNYILSAENGNVVEGSFLINIGMQTHDFEPDFQGWTHSTLSAGYIDQWHRSSQRNYTAAGMYSMKFGFDGNAQYASSAHGALISPEFVLTPNSTFSFWHWMDAEENEDNPSQAWDGGLVQMSLDDGEWFAIEPSGGYTHHIVDNPASPFEPGTAVYSGSFGWTEAEFDLGEYSGIARFRFVFGSDGYVAGEGWYIDDVRLLPGPTSSIDPISTPTAMTLMQNYPNPFNPTTHISFSLPQTQHVRLSIYNMRGQLVKTLVNEKLKAGQNTLTWDGKDNRGNPVATGIYSYRIQSNGQSISRKMMLMK